MIKSDILIAVELNSAFITFDFTTNNRLSLARTVKIDIVALLILIFLLEIISILNSLPKNSCKVAHDTALYARLNPCIVY